MAVQDETGWEDAVIGAYAGVLSREPANLMVEQIQR